MKHTIEVKCPVFPSFRVRSVSGMFDVPIEQRGVFSLQVEVPDLSDDWRIGAIVGPSGAGKSTIAREVLGEHLYTPSDWPTDCAVVDAFPPHCDVQQITHVLTAVGFSSPPSWIKPYHVLSNGERFRCDLTRALLSEQDCVVFDEFTSVVDRTVAKIGSVALKKALSRGAINKRFVAVTCHYDILEWLEPDWVLDLGAANPDGSIGQLTRRRLRRPSIELEVFRCGHEAWHIFKKHHYLARDISKASICFLATFEGKPAAFVAWLPFFGRIKSGGKAYRDHRRVTLPDFQGVGIMQALGLQGASLFAGLGYEVFSQTAHPGEIRARIKSPYWAMTRSATRTAKDKVKTRATDRLTTAFKYIGPKMPAAEATRMLQTFSR